MRDARRTAVVGAGLAGLTAARHLSDTGHGVTIFDKSRGQGGRLATRRTARGAFDHGCPALDPRSTDFAQWLKQLGSAMARDESGSLYGVPSMSKLVRPLATGLELRSATRIAKLGKGSRGWHLTDETRRIHGPFDSVIMALPAPQAAALVRGALPDMAAELDAVRMAPVWTCMAAFAQRLDLPDTVRPGGAILRADRGSSKPGRDDLPETWVIHMTPAYTRDHLDLDRHLIAADLLDQFAKATGHALPAATHLDAHRWLYGLTEVPLGRPFASDPSGCVLAGGDWALGSDAEHAWTSGNAMAQALLSLEVQTA